MTARSDRIHHAWEGRTSTMVTFGSSVKRLASMISVFSVRDFNVGDRSGTHSSAGKRTLVRPFHR
jgi:hypothetical protein